jgi:hypothetical protein
MLTERRHDNERPESCHRRRARRVPCRLRWRRHANTQASAAANFPELRATILTGARRGATSHGSNNQAWAAAMLPEVTVLPRASAMAIRAATPWRRTATPEARLRGVGAHALTCGRDGNVYDAPITTTRENSTRVNGTIAIESGGANYIVTRSLSPNAVRASPIQRRPDLDAPPASNCGNFTDPLQGRIHFHLIDISSFGAQQD